MKICKTMYHDVHEYNSPVCTRSKTEWVDTYRFMTEEIEITIYIDMRCGNAKYDIDTDYGEKSYFVGEDEEIILYEDFLSIYEDAVSTIDALLWVGEE